MKIQSGMIRCALESLWNDVVALSRNPLVEALGLANGGAQGDYERAMALIDAILQAAQRLKRDHDGGVFQLLNTAYGLEGETQRRYQLMGARPEPSELAAQTGLTAQEYDQQLTQAIAQLETKIHKP